MLERLRAWSLALSFALVSGAVLAVATTPGIARGNGRIGGDLVAFLAAGQLVGEGRGASLYDLRAQAEAQRPWLPGAARGSVVPFAYPPTVALLYAPLAWLPLRIAYLLHLACSLLATALAAHLLAGAFPSSAGQDRWATLGVLGAFWPLWHASEIGQNTPFSLASFALVAFGMARARPTLAGLGAGLLLLKPPLGAAALLLLVVRKSWRALAVAAAVALVIHATGVLAAGPDWPSVWLDAVRTFARHDAGADLAWSVSAWALLEPWLPGRGPVVALLLALGLGGLAQRADDPRAAVALAVCAAVLVPPHAGFYEAGLMALPALWLLDAGGARAAAPLASLWALTAVGYFTTPGRVHLYVVPVLWISAWTAWSVGRPKRGT